ncbi:MAG: hypothetical protein ABJM58_13035 [Alteripontixanthobacter sp.]
MTAKKQQATRCAAIQARQLAKSLIESSKQQHPEEIVMEIKRDGNGSPYIEWEQANDCYKRAWIQRKTDDRDWAKTGRYLNVVRCNQQGRPGGNPTDFPIFDEDAPDDELLISFVRLVNGLTGCRVT